MANQPSSTRPSAAELLVLMDKMHHDWSNFVTTYRGAVQLLQADQAAIDPAVMQLLQTAVERERLLFQQWDELIDQLKTYFEGS